MDRCVVLVDAGYLLGAAASLLAGEPARSRITVDHAALIQGLRERAEADTQQPLLRIYWFDGAPDRVPQPEHRRLRVMPRVTVRLGALTRSDGRWAQKGVDAAMHAELTELARNRACSDVVLVTGDGDLLPGLMSAKEHGVAVHLWAVQAADGDYNQSEDLVAEADERRVLDRAWITRAVRAKDLGGACAPQPATRPEITAILSAPLPEAALAASAERASEAAAQAAAARYGTGNHGVRALAGSIPLHEELEAEVATVAEREAAIVFGSGYAANVGTIGALVGPGDTVFVDKYAHASIVDGCRLSGATVVRFRHNDTEHLARRMEAAAPGGVRLAIVDSVYSMDGDIAPLPRLREVCDAHEALLMTDEAHALGVIGRTGLGVEEHFDRQVRVDVKLGTLSKAIPSMGGWVAGSAELIGHLRYAARPFLFSAALAPAAGGAPPGAPPTNQTAHKLNKPAPHTKKNRKPEKKNTENK
ncbi:aminotransferase class I/II-fold pyridoxal phosphate-dependent enzyme, partial [Streptomyces durocortorensis]|uniref:aminotransferase class I/II-fold pyridoxal phosphate-dependent enzyme n=1 Tax=Streptomyces durocortorensis TaxID=2811104 RepID=UPI0027DE4B52